MKKLYFLFYLCIVSVFVSAKEYHVAKNGNDNNPGSGDAPFLTIQAAANVAVPGDVVTVHEGVYREEIAPPRGGLSDEKRIVYQAHPGDEVVIKGSEQISGWEFEKDGVWVVRIPNSLFGDFNPFADEVTGDWFDPKGRKHHTGCVYSEGHWLFEAASKKNVFGNSGSKPSWFAEVGEDETKVWACFGEKDPNKTLTEVNVRQTVFYPRKPFVNYITVRGFKMCHAAPKWAPPTAEQMGLIGTHWSRGWIIENNDISYSVNVGLSLGKYGDQYDNMAPTAEAYLNTIERARNQMGWNKSNIGSHIIRNNEISYCEQAGIVGSMGASFSTIIGNHIHHIHTQRRFGGAEMAGIKFHAPIDMLIKGNRIHNTCLAIWLDWMTQGTRTTSNLLYKNDMDLYLEVNHGPFLVDNNICLSETSRHLSQGGAYVHNLFACKWGNWEDPRSTPYFKPHSTEKIGDHKLNIGDDRFFNNVFVGNGKKALTIIEENGLAFPFYWSYGLKCYEFRPQLPETGGNIYYNAAEPCSGETAVEIRKESKIELAEKADGLYLYLTVDAKQVDDRENNKLVTSKLLGKATVPDAPFEDYDGSELIIDTDYFGKKRDLNKPSSGPFEIAEPGRLKFKVWPLDL